MQLAIFVECIVYNFYLLTSLINNFLFLLQFFIAFLLLIDFQMECMVKIYVNMPYNFSSIMPSISKYFFLSFSLISSSAFHLFLSMASNNRSTIFINA